MKEYDADHEALIKASQAGTEVAFVNHLLAEARAGALLDAADELARRGHRSAVTRVREMALRVDA